MEAEAKSRIHPLVATAAVAVIILSAVAVAAITGYLPGSSAQKQAAEAPVAAAPAAAPVAPAPAAAPQQAVAKQKPAQTKVAHAAAAKPTAPTASATQVAAAAPATQVCADCGTVTSVNEVKVKGAGTGLGAVAGGVAGAVLGSQVGRGNTRTIAGVAGAAGGAYAGHEIEKRVRAHTKYDVGVKMDDGSVRTISYDAPPAWHAGDKVRVVDGKLEPAR